MEKDKAKRNLRIAAIAHILTETPNKIFTLGRFCQMFGSAKSTISEDINLLRAGFAAYGLGQVETVPGAAGGVRYLPFPVKGARDLLEGLCKKLSDPARVLPGGYIYVNDILSAPAMTDAMGRMLASQFYRNEPDFVLTVETKGVPLAQSVARALGITTVVARRDPMRGHDWPNITINYVSGSTGRLQTMSLAKRLVQPGQRALIVDDFMRGGATARAMMEMMREFSVTVVGVGMMLTRQAEGKHRVDGAKSLMTVHEMDEETGARVLPCDWIE